MAGKVFFSVTMSLDGFIARPLPGCAGQPAGQGGPPRFGARGALGHLSQPRRGGQGQG